MPRKKPTVEQRVKSIGDKVFKARKSKGWSLQNLSDESGVPKATLVNIEHGRYVPKIAVLTNIAEALDLPFTYFV